MSNYSGFHIRDARSLRFLYLLTINCSKISGRCAKLLSMTLCAIKGRGLVNAKATAFNVLWCFTNVLISFHHSTVWASAETTNLKPRDRREGVSEMH